MTQQRNNYRVQYVLLLCVTICWQTSLAVANFFFVKICRQKFSKFLPLTPLGLDLMQLYSSYSNVFDMNLKRNITANWCHLLSFLHIYWHRKLKMFSRPCLNRYPHFILTFWYVMHYFSFSYSDFEKLVKNDVQKYKISR